MKTEPKGKCGVVSERYVNVQSVSRYTSLPVKSLYELASLGQFRAILNSYELLQSLVYVFYVAKDL